RPRHAPPPGPPPAAGGARLGAGAVGPPPAAAPHVEGAAVTLMTSGGRQLDRVVSHADGAYILAVPAPGTYLLAVTAASYGSRAVHVTVADGPLVHDVELAPGGVDAVS
ncbi:carboxypeptidase-like regulatory domain-containing protein, partial [Streptomyces sp. NPDC007057]|uniref:carboxypeptidase-like regulatory domain-containing protein n=1 Tax=Streptomyces sp. NPDC007057 TaxID=3154586 RepID=UPI0033DA89F8